MITSSNSLVNCEDAVRIGNEIQSDLDNESPVKSMKTSKKCRKVGDKKLYIEKTQLFNRLIIMAERDEGIEQIFKFELTPVPTSFFTMDRMMRKPKNMNSAECSRTQQQSLTWRWTARCKMEVGYFTG